MSRMRAVRGVGRRLSRREAVLRLAGALAAVGVAGCTPARIVLHLYPEMFDHDDALCQRVLAAFARTVVPSASAQDPNLTRAYSDPAFPLAKYRGYFASDLCQRAMRVGGARTFDQLDATQRRAVVAAAAADRGTTGRLYRGAIYLTQIALYAGIYDDVHGDPAIAFRGRYHLRPLSQTSYPDPSRFLPVAMTVDGNPA